MNNEGNSEISDFFLTQTSQYTGLETYTGPYIEAEGKDYGRYF